MTRTRSTGAPEGTVSGSCRTPRSRGQAPRGKEWVRAYKRGQHALDDAASMVISVVRKVADAGRCAARPVRSTRILTGALRQVTVAMEQHAEAERCLAEAAEAFEHTPPELQDDDAAELLELAAERSETVQHYIYLATQEVLLGQAEIIGGVAAGEVEPEDPSVDPSAEDRPRRRVIVIAPRRSFVRAFLAARRRPRAADRITPVLRRRRRTPLPAEVRVPSRNLRGRAPPLSPACSL